MDSELFTLPPQRCCMCATADGLGRWSLCDPCRDRMKQRAERHAADAKPAKCAGCDYKRPAGLYCPSCERRFSRRF